MRGSTASGCACRCRRGLVVNAEGLVGVLDELVNGESGVVGLHNGIRHLGEGTTEKVAIIRSGNSSRILEIRRCPYRHRYHHRASG